MAGVVESEPVVSIRTRAEFRPDGVLLRHVDREGAKFCQLSTRATLGHLVAELRKKGYRVCCPRQYGGRYPTWPRLRYLLECMKPSFSVDLDCRARLFVDCTDSKSRRLQETTTVFFAALPSSTLSLEALHRRTTELEEMDYQRFNSRPGKNSLFHCLYSARRHLLDCPASQQGQSTLARISDKLDTVALLRATDFLVKRQRGECIELLRRALELCRTTTVKQSGTPQEGRCDDTESEETAITRTSSLSLSDIGVDLARPTDSLRASAAAGNV